MKKKSFLSLFMASIMCMSLIAPYHCKEANAMTVLETDVETASQDCTMLGIYGSYYSQAQDALDRINEIRKEACEAGNVPYPGKSLRMLEPEDYVPIKWSKDLESVARIRAMEGGLAYSFLSSGHSRLNEKEIWSVQYNGVESSAENLAYNWGTSMVSGINQWYEEKSDWVNQTSGKVTGHYTSMINPKYTYIGLGDFYTKEAKYPNTLAAAFCSDSKNLDQSMQTAHTDIMQKIEVKNSYIDGYILEGNNTIDIGTTTELTLRANLVNGSNKLKLWVLDPVTYTSSNTSVAQVTNTGIVTGRNAGTATITVKSDDTVLATTVITIVSTPAIAPSATPAASASPSVKPATTPSAAPAASASPSIRPATTPSTTPAASAPSVRPATTPSATPAASASPSVRPTTTPSATPAASASPSARPTTTPSASPSARPTTTPTAKPSTTPTAKPTARPTTKPTARPTTKPTARPTTKPTAKPTVAPTVLPKPIHTKAPGETAKPAGTSNPDNLSPIQRNKALFKEMKVSKKMSVKKGKSKKLKLTLPDGVTVVNKFTGKDGEIKVSYYSSDKGIAKVNKKGKITAKKKGTASITTVVAFENRMAKSFTTTIKVKKDKKAGNAVMTKKK